MAKSTAVAKAKIQLPANIAQQLAAEAASIASRIGSPGGDKISTKGKRFNMPSGEQHPGPMNVVIIDFVAANYLYDREFTVNDMAPPICAAQGDGRTTLVAYNESPEKQCETCSACPKNQWGTDLKGGRGKACSNLYFLAVMAPDATVDTPLLILKVSSTGLKSFDAYVSSVARSFQAPPVAVLTEISFDAVETYPTLRFGNPAPISAELLALAMSRRDEARTRLLAQPDFSAYVPAKITPKKAVSNRGR